jgi:hypothetical protein
MCNILIFESSIYFSKSMFGNIFMLSLSLKGEAYNVQTDVQFMKI